MRHNEIAYKRRGNPLVPLSGIKNIITSLSFKGKQIVLNTGWLCIFSNMYFGSF